MAKVLIEESTLTNIADAIRVKTGKTSLMKPSEMGGAIENIKIPKGLVWNAVNVAFGYGSFSSFFEINGCLYLLGTSYRSVDGETFSSYGFSFVYFEYGNGLWIGCRDGYGKKVYYSTDGMKWSESNDILYSGMYRYPCYGNGIFVIYAFDTNSKYLYYSTDGKTWTRSITLPGYIYGEIVYGNGRFAACINNCIYYSTDGKTWTQSTRDGVYGIYYNNGIFITVDDSNGGMYYSTDCITWTQCSGTSGYAFNYYGVSYVNGLWYNCTNTDFQLWYSTDGKTWSSTDIPIASAASYTVIFNGKIYVYANSNGVYTSTDGKSWTNINSLTGYLLYANGMFILCNIGADDHMYYSFDGINWKQSLGIYRSGALCYFKGKYFCGRVKLFYTEDFAF